MKKRHQLWFQIESAFSQIIRLCESARADELRARAAPETKFLAEFGGLEAKDREERTQVGPAPRRLSGLEPPSPLAVRSLGADIVALRAELRKQLTILKSALGETLTERETYYVLFPIVVYTDELVYSATEGRAGAWNPLQRELFEIDNGGELFFTMIESLLKKDETLPLIFEVFYFCLTDGFLGMCQNEPAKIEEYRARLAYRIPTTQLEGPRRTEQDEGAVELIEFPRRYYLTAGGAVAAMYVLFLLVAHFQVGQ